MAESITLEQLKTLMAGDRRPALFDVRRAADYQAAARRIAGAERLDPEKVDEWIDDVPQDRPVVVYCVKGGSVSQSTADRLLHKHSDVRYLQGGIKAWTEAGEALEDEA